MKTLVVYFSRKGYVKKAAEEKARELNAEVLRLETTEKTQGVLGFWWCGRFGMHRWGMPLKPLNTDVSSYDKVVICSPIWVFTVSAPVREFAAISKGKIKAAEYIFLHYSFPMRYDKAAAWLDSTLGIKRTAYTSVCCVLGKILNTKTFVPDTER